MKRWIVVLSLFVAGCGSGKPPDPTDRAEATGTAGVLFEVDGVRVYRFVDGGHYHYFAVPRNGFSAMMMTDWSETHCSPCGKSTCCYTIDEHENVSTLARR